MPKLTYNAAAGDLTIGGIAMNGPAWKVMNLHVLQQPADQRGDDRRLAGATGDHIADHDHWHRQVCGVQPAVRVQPPPQGSQQAEQTGEGQQEKG